MLLIKRLFIVILNFLLIFLLSFCDDDETIVKNEELEIAGYYEATIIYEPGHTDGGVDILANGGELSINLYSNYTADFDLFIPLIPNSNQSYPPSDTSFTGKFRISSDTVYFSETYLFNKPFQIRGDTLEFKLIGVNAFITQLVKQAVTN